MTTLSIEGKKVKVSGDFLSLSREQQEATVEEIAQSMNIQAGGSEQPVNGFFGQVNRGIADFADTLNPFDTPAVANAIGMRTSAPAAPPMP